MSTTVTSPIRPHDPITTDRELLLVVRRAVATGSPAKIIAILKDALVDMARNGGFDHLEFPLPAPDHYTRRLVFSDAWERFTIIAMTWGVGHATPLHDHAGVWCVEVVVDGDMEVVNYELLEEDRNGLCRFEKRETIPARPASSGALIPPFEHHIFGNSGTKPSHTLHIYGGPMNRCDTFTPAGDGLWQRQHRQLRYDM